MKTNEAMLVANFVQQNGVTGEVWRCCNGHISPDMIVKIEIELRLIRTQ